MMVTCRDCNGSGIIEVDDGYDDEGEERCTRTECNTCGGAGELDDEE